MLHLVAVFCQVAHVPELCVRIAGNIDYLLRGQLYQRGQEVSVAAGTGRVHKDNVYPLPLLCPLYHKLSCICGVKRTVLHVV